MSIQQMPIKRAALHRAPKAT